MNKLDYVLVFISYIFSTVSYVVRGDYYVSNLLSSDLITAGLGSFLGAFIMTSIITLPLQFFSGWNKNEYTRKTLIGSIILQIFLIIINM